MQSWTSKGILWKTNKIGLNIGYYGIGQASTLLTNRPIFEFQGEE